MNRIAFVSRSQLIMLQGLKYMKIRDPKYHRLSDSNRVGKQSGYILFFRIPVFQMRQPTCLVRHWTLVYQNEWFRVNCFWRCSAFSNALRSLTMPKVKCLFKFFFPLFASQPNRVCLVRLKKLMPWEDHNKKKLS